MKALINLIRHYVLGRKSVAIVLSGLEKPLKDLELAAQQHTADVEANVKRIAKLTEQNVEKEAAKARALLVHSNLSNLLGLSVTPAPVNSSQQ